MKWRPVWRSWTRNTMRWRTGRTSCRVRESKCGSPNHPHLLTASWLTQPVTARAVWLKSPAATDLRASIHIPHVPDFSLTASVHLWLTWTEWALHVSRAFFFLFFPSLLSILLFLLRIHFKSVSLIFIQNQNSEVILLGHTLAYSYTLT